MPNVRLVLSWFLLLVCCVGCDDDEQQMRDWSRENSAAAQALVEADAESRKQFTALQQSVQTERQTLADGYTALEADRKAVAAARERVPLLATALQGVAALALGGAALWVCVRLLGNLPDDQGAAELEETLILTLAGESNLLAEPPPLLRQSAPTAALTDENETVPLAEPVLSHEEA
jgi:hypothetical protein